MSSQCTTSLHTFFYIPVLAWHYWGKTPLHGTEIRDQYKLQLSHVCDNIFTCIHFWSLALRVGDKRTDQVSLRPFCLGSAHKIHQEQKCVALEWGNCMGFCCTYMQQINIKCISCRPPNIRLLVIWTWIELKALSQRILSWISLIRKLVNIYIL